MSVLKWVLVFVLQLPVSGLFAQSLLVLDDQTHDLAYRDSFFCHFTFFKIY